jgi:SAM-dependent methyltransferase
MDPISKFNKKVKKYTLYRPGYPSEIITFLQEELSFNKEHVVADIGSGTGLFTKLILENGNLTFGIEPNFSMREQSITELSNYQNFTIIDGRAEDTKLDTNSIDFIFAVQSFHWFNNNEARKEFKRILRNNGYVVLIWNQRSTDNSSFLKSYELLLKTYARNYNPSIHNGLDESYIKSFYYPNKYHIKKLFRRQLLNYKELKGRLLSTTYAPGYNDPNYKLILIDLKTLFNEYNENGVVQIDYCVYIYYGKLIN